MKASSGAATLDDNANQQSLLVLVTDAANQPPRSDSDPRPIRHRATSPIYEDVEPPPLESRSAISSNDNIHYTTNGSTVHT